MAIGDEVVLASDPNEEEEEEELVDPQDSKKEECGSSSECQKYKAMLDECNAKVEGGQGRREETCQEELFDFMHCVDSCVSKSLFGQLK